MPGSDGEKEQSQEWTELHCVAMRARQLGGERQGVIGAGEEGLEPQAAQ